MSKFGQTIREHMLTDGLTEVRTESRGAAEFATVDLLVIVFTSRSTGAWLLVDSHLPTALQAGDFHDGRTDRIRA